MKKMLWRTNILSMIMCAAMLIGCTAGSSVEESKVVEEMDLSEGAGMLGSEIGSTGGSGDAVKEDGQLMDDTYYVVDIYSTLMLCEDDGVPGYKDAIQALKGDSASVAEAIERLGDMEQTPAVMNAIGVGYMRLDQSEEAKKILEGALEMADDDQEQACILNNLGSVRFLKGEDIINDRVAVRYEQALEMERDPIRRIVIRANRLVYGPYLYLKDDKWKEKIDKDIEQILKDEKSVLGSNQLAGIRCYLTLAECGPWDKVIGYYEKALGLNREQYQYRAIDMSVYSSLRKYYRINGDLERALGYADKGIEAGEGFLLDTDDFRIGSYLAKGILLVKRKDYDEAIQCLAPILELEGYDMDLKAMIYLSSGEAYYGKGDFSKAEEMVKKAYDFFGQYKKEKGHDDWDSREMLEAYDEEDRYESDPEYMQWVWDQIQG